MVVWQFMLNLSSSRYQWDQTKEEPPDLYTKHVELSPGSMFGLKFVCRQSKNDRYGEKEPLAKVWIDS
jgi:hypothetical protein